MLGSCEIRLTRANPGADGWVTSQVLRIIALVGPQGYILTSARGDSVKCHLPIEYAADLTVVVAGKEAGASWNARGMENALDS